MKKRKVGADVTVGSSTVHRMKRPTQVNCTHSFRQCTGLVAVEVVYHITCYIHFFNDVREGEEKGRLVSR